MDITGSENYRDRPINIDERGKRSWIYARQPQGKWYTRRTIVGWSLLLFLVIAPLIKINGHPFMQLDIAHRKFYLFGALVWAQDTYVLAIIMLVTVVSIVLFTVVFGRLWCGWACPQTLFLEMVFRRIEYIFDGNYRKGIKKPNTVRTLLKHGTYLVVTIFFTNVFLMWFTGPDRLVEIITSPISQNKLAFVFMLGISLVYYCIYAFFREQVCTMVCPYGRIQGVLLDSRSISVIYDFKRGEPRGAKNSGHCIDCGRCIKVCPTGIDIKNGSQLECINCTACIDECNQVMEKLKRPRNLIRYDSYNGVESGKRKIINPRSMAYSAVLFTLFTFLVITVSTRSSVDFTVLRVPGTIYQEIDKNTLSNLYNVTLINKTDKEIPFQFKLAEKDAILEFSVSDTILHPNQKLDGLLVIKFDKLNLDGHTTDIEVVVISEEELLTSNKINFIGPN